MSDDREWIEQKWEEINARAEKAQADLHEAERMANQLLVDVEFLSIMVEEDLI